MKKGASQAPFFTYRRQLVRIIFKIIQKDVSLMFNLNNAKI